MEELWFSGRNFSRQKGMRFRRRKLCVQGEKLWFREKLQELGDCGSGEKL